MINKLRPLVGVVAMAAAGMTASAYADDTSDVYIGGGVGAYTLDIDNTSFDDGARFVRGFVGLKLMDNIALEGDYTRLLEAEDSIAGNASDFEADAWGVSVRPIFPLSEHVDVYAKAGWTWYDAKFRSAALGVPVGVRGEGDDFTWGGGVDLHLSDGLSLRADYSKIEFDGADLDMLSAGLTFRF